MNPDLAMGDALLKKTGSGNLRPTTSPPWFLDTDYDGDAYFVRYAYSSKLAPARSGC